MAFVAMGGNSDKSGCINTERLIQVIRNEFEMTIDIEKLIEVIDADNSKSIDYDEFKSIFSNAGISNF